MTYEQIKAMVDGMTDEEFTNLVYCANERISDFDRDHQCIELCKSAMSIVAATIDGPASSAYSELSECIDGLNEILGKE